MGGALAIGLAVVRHEHFRIRRDQAFGVDAGDQILVDGGLGPKEITLGGVKAPHDRGLARHPRQGPAAGGRGAAASCHHALGLGIGRDLGGDGHHLEGAFLIRIVLRQHLMLPGDFSGFRLDGKAGVGTRQRGSTFDAALGIRRRTDTAGAIENQIQLGIIGDRTPHTCHPAFVERHAAPGFVARLALVGNQGIAPQFLAGLGVVAGDVAALRRFLTACAGNHHAVHHDRAGGVGDIEIAAAIEFPKRLAGFGVQRQHEIVSRDGVDLVVIEKDAALTLAPEIVVEGLLRRQVAAVLPEQAAGRCINRLDHVIGIAQEHHAFVDDGGSLIDARLHGAGPDQLQPLHIGLVDLIQAAEAVAFVIAAHHDPVGRIGIAQNRIRDRRVAGQRMGGDGRAIHRRGRLRHRDTRAGGEQHCGDSQLQIADSDAMSHEMGKALGHSDVRDWPQPPVGRTNCKPSGPRFHVSQVVFTLTHVSPITLKFMIGESHKGCSRNYLARRSNW